MKTIFSLFFVLLCSKVISNNFFPNIQFEGECCHIAICDSYIYFNSGANINILDISDKNTISVIKTFHLKGQCIDLQVQLNTLFVSTQYDGIFLYDIQVPEKPVLVSNIPASDQFIKKVLVSGIHLVTLSYNQAMVYNIDSPAKPIFLYSFDFEMNPRYSFALSNSLLYGFSQDGFSGPQSIETWKLGTTSAQLVQSLEVSPNAKGAIPECMQEFENNLLIAFNDTLKIFRISKSGSIAYSSQFSLPGEVGLFQIQDEKLYAHVSDSGIVCFDIADISNPKETDFYQAPGQLSNFRVNDNLIFKALNNNGLSIIESSNHSEIFSYDKCAYAHSIVVHESMAFVGFKQKLVVYNVSDPRNPILLTTVDSLGGIKRLDYNNGFLYCLHEANDLLIIDVGSTGKLDYINRIKPLYSYYSDYIIKNNKLYVLETGGYFLIYDLSKPEEPKLLEESLLSISNTFNLTDSFLVTFRKIPANPPTPAQTVLQLNLLEDDFSISLLNELILGDYMKWFNPIKVEIVDSLIIVGTHAGVFIVKYDKDYNLELSSHNLIYIKSNVATDITLDEKNIYFSGYRGKPLLLKFDYSNPDSLIIVDSLTTNVNDLELSGDFLYSANEENGFVVYGIEELTNKIIKPGTVYQPCNYPNPCKNYIVIKTEVHESKSLYLEIFNLEGKKIETIDIKNQKNTVLNTSHYKPGIYFYRINADRHSTTNCFIKN
jgi:hypothetical protein